MTNKLLVTTYSHGTSSNLLSDDNSEMKQLNKTTKIINTAHNGCVKIRADVRRMTLFGLNTNSDFATEKRKKFLLLLTMMNVCKLMNFNLLNLVLNLLASSKSIPSMKPLE